MIKKYIYIVLIMVICIKEDTIIQLSYSRNINTKQNIALTLIDSIDLPIQFKPKLLFDFPYIIADKEHIYFLNDSLNTIMKFDYQGKIITSFDNNLDTNKKLSSCGGIYSLFSINNYIGALHTSNYLFIYTSEGKYIKETPLQNYSIYDGVYTNFSESSIHKVEFNSKNNIFFIPVTFNNGYYNTNTANFNNPLLGKYEFDLQQATCKLVDVIGKRDSIYFYKNLPYLNDWSYCIDTIHSYIYLSQNATNNIYKYDFYGNLLSNFGNTATFYGKSYQYESISQKLVKKENTNRSTSFFMYIRTKSLVYENSYYCHSQNLLFRIYRPSIALQSFRGNKKMKIQYYLEKQTTKPYAVQIYNNEHIMISDTLLNTPFNVVSSFNNYLWVHGKYITENKSYRLYKYEINVSNI